MRSRLGLSIYAIGSNRLAAFRSGVPVGRTKILAYALTGLFAALGGLSLTASTGIGTPVPGPYTLLSVAAVVLGGVSLAGGRGGVFGPIVGVVVLQLIQTDMTFLSLDPNLALVAQGVILIGVVMVGSVIQLRRSRAMSAAVDRRIGWRGADAWRGAVPRPPDHPADRPARHPRRSSSSSSTRASSVPAGRTSSSGRPCRWRSWPAARR